MVTVSWKLKAKMYARQAKEKAKKLGSSAYEGIKTIPGKIEKYKIEQHIRNKIKAEKDVGHSLTEPQFAAYKKKKADVKRKEFASWEKRTMASMGGSKSDKWTNEMIYGKSKKSKKSKDPMKGVLY